MAIIIFAITLIVVCFPSKAQDQSLNNLIHTEGYRTAPLGQLGSVKKTGSGKQDVILIPGWGFDSSIFTDFMERHEEDYRMFAITLPGFGNTSAPPMPDPPDSYGDLYWTKAIVRAIDNLIDQERLNKPIVISYFIYSNIIAMRLALDYSDKIGKVIIISGSGKFTMNYPSFEPRNLETRIAYIDKGLAEQWFKTVSKETWDNGNYVPGTFSKDSLKAKKYWNMMSSVPIPVMVRYLCESYATDLSFEYQNLKVPVLIVLPAFTSEFLSIPAHSYIPANFHFSWQGALPASKEIQMVTLSDTHAFIMDDQPEKLDKVIAEFMNGTYAPYPPLR